MTKPFWEFEFSSNDVLIGVSETGPQPRHWWICNPDKGITARKMGLLFLCYADSTPSGAAYQLTYGSFFQKREISSPSTDNEAAK